MKCICCNLHFKDKDYPTHVYKLNKAIYRLKQALRASYTKLSKFPLQFVYRNDNIIIYIFVYVDDLIVTGNNERLISDFLTKLTTRFFFLKI